MFIYIQQYLEFQLEFKRRQLWTTTRFALSYPGLYWVHSSCIIHWMQYLVRCDDSVLYDIQSDWFSCLEVLILVWQDMAGQAARVESKVWIWRVKLQVQPDCNRYAVYRRLQRRTHHQRYLRLLLEVGKDNSNSNCTIEIHPLICELAQCIRKFIEILWLLCACHSRLLVFWYFFSEEPKYWYQYWGTKYWGTEGLILVLRYWETDTSTEVLVLILVLRYWYWGTGTGVELFHYAYNRASVSLIIGVYIGWAAVLYDLCTLW